MSGWENEKYEPDLNSLKKMSKIFNVSIDYILGNSNETFTKQKDEVRPYEKIINFLSQLNPLGIEKAESYILDLLDNPKYTVDSEINPNIPSLEEAIRLQQGTPYTTLNPSHDNIVHKAAFGGGVWKEKK